MASKQVTRSAQFEDIRYDVETHNLLFVGKGGGKSLMFLGVPPDLFYGMPTGQNVANFITLKLTGRYSLVEIQPPPLITFSTINQEFRLIKDNFVYTWKRQDGDPKALSDNPHEAFTLFMATVGRRMHDSMSSAYTLPPTYEPPQELAATKDYPYAQVRPKKPRTGKPATYDPAED